MSDNDTDSGTGANAGRGQARGLAALAADLETVTKRVDAVDKTLKREKPRISAGHSAAKELLDQREKLRTILERLTEVEEGITALAKTVERLAGNDEDSESPGVGSWMQADVEAEQTVAMLRDVAEWVATVLLHYPEVASKLPSCWWRHADLVEHLLVLRACWGVAFDAASGTALARADWLERHLPAAVDRIAATGRDCLRDHKVHGPRAGYAVPTEAELVEQAQAWSVQDREVRPVPTGSSGPGRGAADPYSAPNSYRPQP